MKNAVRFKYFFGLLKINNDTNLPFWDNFLAVNEEEGVEEYMMVSYQTFLECVYKDYKKDKRDISFEEYINEKIPPNKKE